MAIGCNVPLPVGTVDDFRFVLMAYFEDARRAKARSVYYKYTATGNSKTRFGDTKVASFKEKNQANPNILSRKGPEATAVAVNSCTFGGTNNHVNAGCRTRISEFTNNQNRPYIRSEAHGRLVKAVGARECIPNFKELKAGQSSIRSHKRSSHSNRLRTGRAKVRT